MLRRELIGRRGLQYIVIDRYEVGTQNWTDDMLDQSRHRCGYERPWQPEPDGRRYHVRMRGRCAGAGPPSPDSYPVGKC
jgi:hypothetical protein